MAPDDRTSRWEVLARQVRRAVIDLTSEQRRELTSIQDVARRLRVNDFYLLLDALEIAIRRGWMRVASGIITVCESARRADGNDVRRRTPRPAGSRPVRRAWRARAARRARR